MVSTTLAPDSREYGNEEGKEAVHSPETVNAEMDIAFTPVLEIVTSVLFFMMRCPPCGSVSFRSMIVEKLSQSSKSAASGVLIWSPLQDGSVELAPQTREAFTRCVCPPVRTRRRRGRERRRLEAAEEIGRLMFVAVMRAEKRFETKTQELEKARERKMGEKLMR